MIEKPRGRTSPRLIGAAVFGALLIAAGALAVAFWSRGPAGDESAPSPRAADEVAPSDARETRETGPAASAAPAEPDLVAIRLQGVPEGARVFLDGLPTESTTLHLRRSPEVRRVKVTLEGRAPWERLVTAEEDRIIPVELPSPPGATEPDAGTGEAPRPGRRPPRSETNREGIPQLRTRFPEGR